MQFWLHTWQPILVNKPSGRTINEKIENKVGEVGKDGR